MDRDHNWDHGGAEYSETEEGEIAARARDYLLAQGAPARFFYYFVATEDLRLVPVNEAGELIRFGLTRDQDMVCMSTVDSSVWEVSAKANGTRSLINTSLSSFLEFMAICEERISAHERVALDYWVTWSDLRLCGMVILADQARDDAFSADAAQVNRFGHVPDRLRVRANAFSDSEIE